MMIINDRNDPRIEEFTHLRESTLLANNLALCESEKIFLKLIHNNIQIKKVLCLKEFAIKHNMSGENIFICERSILDSISGFKTVFDVIALFQRPLELSLDKLGNKIIALNGLSSPENVGSIIRSSAAFNVNNVIVDSKTCSPYLRRCIRVSMGNVFSMNTFHSKKFKDDLQYLRDCGYKIYSTANISKAKDYSQFEYHEKSVLIIGSEGHGIDQDIIDFSDDVLLIPINPNVAHLNAANAASIFLSRFNI